MRLLDSDDVALRALDITSHRTKEELQVRALIQS